MAPWTDRGVLTALTGRHGLFQDLYELDGFLLHRSGVSLPLVDVQFDFHWHFSVNMPANTTCKMIQQQSFCGKESDVYSYAQFDRSGGSNYCNRFFEQSPPHCHCVSIARYFRVGCRVRFYTVCTCKVVDFSGNLLLPIGTVLLGGRRFTVKACVRMVTCHLMQTALPATSNRGFGVTRLDDRWCWLTTAGVFYPTFFSGVAMNNYFFYRWWALTRENFYNLIVYVIIYTALCIKKKIVATVCGKVLRCR